MTMFAKFAVAALLTTFLPMLGQAEDVLRPVGPGNVSATPIEIPRIATPQPRAMQGTRIILPTPNPDQEENVVRPGGPGTVSATPIEIPRIARPQPRAAQGSLGVLPVPLPRPRAQPGG